MMNPPTHRCGQTVNGNPDLIIQGFHDSKIQIMCRGGACTAPCGAKKNARGVRAAAVLFLNKERQSQQKYRFLALKCEA
jgi:hypothetical protein